MSFLLWAFLVFAQLSGLVASVQESPRLVMVMADSIPLYQAPGPEVAVSSYARATLQLRLLEASPDSLWFKVKIGEQKGYQFGHGERYWVRRSDVITPGPSRANVTVDLSLT